MRVKTSISKIIKAHDISDLSNVNAFITGIQRDIIASFTPSHPSHVQIGLVVRYGGRRTCRLRGVEQGLTTSNFFGKNFKLLTHKTKRASILKGVKREDNSITSTIRDTYEAILNFHFPCAPDHTDKDAAFATNTEDIDFIPVTPVEIEAVIDAIKPKKAAGVDGVPEVEGKPPISPPWNIFKILWQHFDHDISGLSIYTDGSKFNNNTGYALVVFRDGIEVRHLLCKLNPEATVFLAELKAIEMAVNLVVSQRMVNAKIISDSRSALLALGNPLNTTPSVSKVKGLIKQCSSPIQFMWTRAHVGTAGNEAADAYAKLSVGNDSIDCKLELPKSYIKNLLQQDTLQQWQAGWNTSLKGRAVFDLCPKVHLKRL
ncbi:uncharacterized protein CEXT_592601, partial [Caerostris extrusa]